MIVFIARRGRLLAWLAGLALLGGCRSTRSCKQGTLMVEVTFDGPTSGADEIDVAVAIAGGAAKQGSPLQHQVGATAGSIEIDFPNGYPAGEAVQVTLVARKNGAPLATATDTVSALAAGCGTLTMHLAGGAAEGGAADGKPDGGTDARPDGNIDAKPDGNADTAGGGNEVGGGPCPALETFDTSTDGFAFNNYNDQGGNVAVPTSDVSPATLVWTDADGDPGRGALRVDAPFSDYNQFVQVQKSFAFGSLQDWTGLRLHVRVKIASGGNTSASAPLVVQPYANSYAFAPDGGPASYQFRGNAVNAAPGNGWQEYVVDLSAGGGFVPSNIVGFGVEISTGAGANDLPKPQAAVIYIDTFSLEGICKPDGGAGGPGANGPMPVTCVQGVTRRPVSALITDFSDAVADPNGTGQFRFGGGSALRMQGGTYTVASGTPGTLSLSGGALTFTAIVEAPSSSDPYPYNTFALYFDGPACVDASAYSGVSFTLGENLRSCSQLTFDFADAEHGRPEGNPDQGLCMDPSSTSCFPSDFLVSPATTSVLFTRAPDFPGLPVAAVDPTKLTAVRWTFSQPAGATEACFGSVTIDNVSFF